MENSDKALNTGAKRVYDVAPSEMFAEFMKSGWAPTPLTGITQDEVSLIVFVDVPNYLQHLPVFA